jgi:hypothetical protein
VEYAYGLGLVDPITYTDTLNTCDVSNVDLCRRSGCPCSIQGSGGVCIRLRVG